MGANYRVAVCIEIEPGQHEWQFTQRLSAGTAEALAARGAAAGLMALAVPDRDDLAGLLEMQPERFLATPFVLELIAIRERAGRKVGTPVTHVQAGDRLTSADGTPRGLALPAGSDPEVPPRPSRELGLSGEIPWWTEVGLVLGVFAAIVVAVLWRR